MPYIPQEPPPTPDQIPEYLSRELRRLEGELQGDYVFANGVLMATGRGTPESNLSAPVGSMYLREDGGANTTLYIKESGTSNTGWIAK